MAYQRKLGRTAAQRKALLRNQVTNLIWYGLICPIGGAGFLRAA